MKDTDSREEALRIIEVFETLPPEKRLEIFRELTPEAREELIGTLRSPGEITRRISPEEMYVTIKSLGEPYAPNLVKMMTGAQLLYYMDVDCWKKDVFDPRAAWRTLELLVNAGDEKVRQFIQIADPELIASILYRSIAVTVRDPDIDLLEQLDTLPPFTLDGTFYVRFRSNEMEDALRAFLDALFRDDVEFYFLLMQRLAGGYTAEDEEDAGRFRKARMSERGFPDFDEAVEVYQYLARSEVGREPLDRDDPPSYVIGYPLRVIEKTSLFRRSLNELTATWGYDRPALELAHLANKVMIADGRDPVSMDELNGSLRKVSGYINIALEEICSDDPVLGAEILRANHMEILFRRGFSVILDLRKEAQRFVRHYEGGAENLGHPLAGLVKGLMRKRPVYAGVFTGEPTNREFSGFEDIHRIRELLDRAVVESQWEEV